MPQPISKFARTESKWTALAATLILALPITVSALGCTRAAQGSSTSGQPETLELRYQGSAGSVTLPELASDLGFLGPIKLDWVGNTISGPQDIQSAATGQTDFGGAFNAAVINLEAAGAPVKAVISYYGSNSLTYNGYYVLDSSPIRSARDLIGKKVAVNTLGAHYEAVLDTYLAQNGFSPSEIKQVQLVVLPPVNAEQSLRAHQVDVAVLGGVLQDRALADGGVHLLFSDYGLLGAFDAGSYVMTNSFRARNPNTTRRFVSAIAQAIEWERNTPRDQVVARFAAIIAKRHRNEDASTIQFWKSSGVASRGGVMSDQDFNRWLSWLVANGDLTRGQVRISDVYTNTYNPYR